MIVDIKPYYCYYRLIFMAVTTMAGEKIGAQNFKCIRLLLLIKHINSKTYIK